MRKLLVIPTYNCEEQIGRLIRKSEATICKEFDEVIFIDNGSSDKTIERTISSLKTIGVRAKVLQNRENLNLGGSLKTGFLYAKNYAYDFVAVLHGDDQAQLADLVPVLNNLDSLKIDLGIGARFHAKSNLIGYSMFRKVGNRVLNLYCILCTGERIDDLIAGLNVFRVSKLDMDEILTYPNDLTFDVHILLSAIDQKHIINFFPITWTETDQVSNAKVFKQAITILRLFTRYLFKKNRALHFPKSEVSYSNYNVLFEKSS
jgi:glycosyltransferase involved in cell wall biosynthesis